MRANVAHQQGIAIGRRVRHHFHTDVAARTCPVLDHNGLTPLFAELLTNDTCERIGRAARCLRHKNLHCTNGEVLCEGAASSERYGHEGEPSFGVFEHAVSPVVVKFQPVWVICLSAKSSCWIIGASKKDGSRRATTSAVRRSISLRSR